MLCFLAFLRALAAMREQTNVSSARYKGLYSQTLGKTWTAKAWWQGRTFRCGTHATEEDAAHARDK